MPSDNITYTAQDLANARTTFTPQEQDLHELADRRGLVIDKTLKGPALAQAVRAGLQAQKNAALEEATRITESEGAAQPTATQEPVRIPTQEPVQEPVPVSPVPPAEEQPAVIPTDKPIPAAKKSKPAAKKVARKK